jgi:hypothetical protein
MAGKFNHLLFARVIFYCIVLELFFCTSISAQYDENMIKAAYIERITRFIEWPGNQNSRDTLKFVVGIFGDSEFYNILKTAFENKTIKERKVEVYKISTIDKIGVCDLCYVMETAAIEIEKIMELANKEGTLIMGGTKNFCEKGIHINFYIQDEKLKFEINKRSIDEGKFKVSSLLLKNSKII